MTGEINLKETTKETMKETAMEIEAINPDMSIPRKEKSSEEIENL